MRQQGQVAAGDHLGCRLARHQDGSDHNVGGAELAGQGGGVAHHDTGPATEQIVEFADPGGQYQDAIGSLREGVRLFLPTQSLDGVSACVQALASTAVQKNGCDLRSMADVRKPHSQRERRTGSGPR